MPDPISGLIGSTVIGAGTSLFGASQQANAADAATAAQTAASQAGLEEQRRQFDLVRGLLDPYVEAGYEGLGGQRDLMGLGGPEAEQAAIDRITGGSQFQEMERQQREGLMAGASATGGLRGGNTQRALAELRPNLLNQLLDKQFSRLGGITTLGQNSAVGVGNAGQSSADNITQLLTAQGNAQARNSLAQGNAWATGAQGVGTAAIQGIGDYQNYRDQGDNRAPMFTSQGGVPIIQAPNLGGF